MPDVIEFIRFYLALFFTVVAAFYTFRIILMKRATKKEVVFFGEKYCKPWWNHLAFRFFRIIIWLVCLIRLFFPETDYFLGIFDTYQSNYWKLFGVFLLSIGFIAIVLINFRLGEHWRSGVDPSGPSKLITDGLYRFTRNPMFVFVAIAQLGFFLALPSCFTALCLAVGLFTLYSQVKVEERHLLALFSDEYEQYKGNVRRWV